MPTLLCLASELKGLPFILEAKRQGCHVVVLMNTELLEADWPWEAIDEHFDMPDIRRQPDVTHAVSYLAKERRFERVIALDDFDVETAAALREHMRLGGMGDSAARLFRDKLAMRERAREKGLAVPAFTGLFHYPAVSTFLDNVPAPWMFKPRSEAGSEGIQQLYHAEQVWQTLEEAADSRSHHLLEQFIPGDVYHVDALTWQGEVLFSLASKYGKPPMASLQGRSVFSTKVLPRDSDEAKQLEVLNRQVITAMGRDYGPTHTEFIRAENGEFYFLETAARVGGGNIEKLIEAATGLAIWQEAARMEIADLMQRDYQLPPVRQDYGGLIACPTNYSHADTSAYNDVEIFYRPAIGEFVSLVLRAETPERIDSLLDAYQERFIQDFMS